MKKFILKVLIVVLAVFMLAPVLSGIIQVGDNTINQVDYQVLYDLDYPQTQLNNHTLRQVFETNNNIPNFNNSDTLNKRPGASWADGQYTINAVAFTSIGANNIIVTTGDKFYFKYKITEKTSTIFLTSGQLTIDDIFAYTSITTNLGYNTYIRSAIIGGSNKETYIGFVSNSSGYLKISEWYNINLTSLGIDTLTETQIDTWFNVYKTLKDIEGVI